MQELLDVVLGDFLSEGSSRSRNLIRPRSKNNQCPCRRWRCKACGALMQLVPLPSSKDAERMELIVAQLVVLSAAGRAQTRPMHTVCIRKVIFFKGLIYFPAKMISQTTICFSLMVFKGLVLVLGKIGIDEINKRYCKIDIFCINKTQIILRKSISPTCVVCTVSLLLVVNQLS